MSDNNVVGFNQLKCHIFHDYNAVFDEKGSTCGVIRKVQWLKDDAALDESKAKLEIRKIYTNGTEEKMGKGYTFSTDNGPNELVISMIDCGFGDTKDIITHVKDRDDFVSVIKNINVEDSSVIDEDGEIFDMRSVLMELGDVDAV